MLQRTDDIRIKWTKVVLPPVFLEEEMPMTDRSSLTVRKPPQAKQVAVELDLFTAIGDEQILACDCG